MTIDYVSSLRTLFAHDATRDYMFDGDAFELTRLDDGRMAMAGVYHRDATAEQQAADVAFVTTFNPADGTRSPARTLAATTVTEDLLYFTLASGTGGNFAVMGHQLTNYASLEYDARVQFYNGAGNALAAAKPITTAESAYELLPNAMRTGSGAYLVTWTDSGTSRGMGTNFDVYGRLYSPEGAALSGEFRVNSSIANQQGQSFSVGLGDGRGFVGWVELAPRGGEMLARGLSGRFIDAKGKPVGGTIALDKFTTGAGLDYDDLQAVALGNGGFVVAWTEQRDDSYPAVSGESIRFQMFDAKGAKIGVETIVATTFARDAKLVELANGGFAIAWQEFDRVSADKSFVRQFGMDGLEIGTKTKIADDNLPDETGLRLALDLELGRDGKVIAVGKGSDSVSGPFVAFSTLDFGDERLIGDGGANNLYGKHGVDDVIFGLGGNDTIRGLSGDDTINAGGGNDTITGGLGADTFVFSAALDKKANVDKINDFSVADDTIALDGAIFTALTSFAPDGKLAEAAFWKSTDGKAHDGDDRIVYNTSNGALIYDSNGNAAGGDVQIATLSAKLALSSADFVVV